MNPSIEPEPNSLPPELGKSLFGAMAGQIQIRLESIEEWDAAMEGVWWEAAAFSDSDEDLTPEEYHLPPEPGQ
jgi:hypothetical protein